MLSHGCCTQSDVFHIITMGCFPAIEVIECMIADTVPLVDYLSENLRVFRNIFTYAKKSSPCMVGFKRRQNKLSDPGHRAIIESKKNIFLLSVLMPYQRRIKQWQ